MGYWQRMRARVFLVLESHLLAWFHPQPPPIVGKREHTAHNRPGE